MKRIASTTSIQVVNNRPDQLFCQSPPRCEFNNEDGCARREFNKLSRKEQDRVMRDIYGIEKRIEETPELVRRGLEDLDATLMNSMDENAILRLARDLCPEFLEEESFRLRFLRVESFDAKKAANRLIKHLERKHDLFGETMLGRRKITMEDLNETDTEFLRIGSAQVVPSKDRGGRHVLFTNHQKWRLADVKTVLRCMWYLLMIIVEDSGSTICEAVEVSYNLGHFTSESFERASLKRVFDLFKATPLRLVGYHYCFDDVRFRMVYGVITVFLGKQARMRARDHEGTHIECRYGLMSYGIPVDDFSVTSDGYEDLSKCQKWIEERQHLEKYDADTEAPSID